MKIIDFHTHLDSDWFGRPLPDRAKFIEGLDHCEIRAACMFTLMGFYGDCSRHNDRLAAHARAHPQRLIPFATADPKLGNEAVRELERCLANPVFRGVKFHNWLQAFACSLTRETMLEILRCAARHRVPVLFHDGTPPYSTTFQIAALARWVPEAVVVLGHAGLGDYVHAAGQLMRELPNLYACFCGPKPGDLEYLVECGGPERLLFGSDFGFSDWRVLAERLDDVREANLDENTHAAVLYRSAEKLLHLDERPL